jgi:hypothetical protein
VLDRLSWVCDLFSNVWVMMLSDISRHGLTGRGEYQSAFMETGEGL